MTDAAPAPATPMTGRDRPLFLLSFRQRDELAAHAAHAGWRVVAARRGEGGPPLPCQRCHGRGGRCARIGG
ncbi:hypothetical protein [Sphingomonas sp. J315]|uniref:hypothetical protein n=1 Tax=Sphingomonas sp. J315 TaxID=2898433 RepID=UPI00289B721A|nr:hypothetical protein [Sphingomonas sp. J315]